VKIGDVHQLLKDTYNDWSAFLEDPQFIRTSKDACITWANRVPYRLANQLEASDVTKLVSDKQYTFQVTTDGSVFQIYYQYDRKGNSLQSARLAFYHARDDGPVNWLRIDYEPTFAKGVLHHDCHMHLSAFPLARCVVAGVPNPRQFVEFVMAVCYPETYKAHRLGQDGEYANPNKITEVNSKCFSAVEHLAYKQIIHLRIPAS
jgi:hypothetical protein